MGVVLCVIYCFFLARSVAKKFASGVIESGVTRCAAALPYYNYLVTSIKKSLRPRCNLTSGQFS